jgi:hypothetical protein
MCHVAEFNPVPTVDRHTNTEMEETEVDGS